ncbi:antibiotic biosynthesis monooxygenase [Paremcibacter congregatus]|uniref:antibiotic biosynthesis monooxygenase family protein n=1 Tax=Paremcibacter congregatus TaxID=2043170 RepID=UPI0030ECC01D|tara:strand:+ start:2021 stop:2353 length:333 start_codon:yes stop_codon:yes gene_type:complete
MNQAPKPPYYAVIFTNVRTDFEPGYAETADRMVALAAEQPGYLGFESVREGKDGISVSYWRDLESIKAWKAVSEHAAAQNAGRETWYKSYTTRIALVEREYSFEAEEDSL